MQRAIKQYKHHIEYMQETNDGLITTNKRLREDLEEVNDHYQELIAVSKEALKRKRSTDLQFAGLKQTIRNLQQQNEELTRRMTEMKDEQQKARRKAQALEGIALLAEAAKRSMSIVSKISYLLCFEEYFIFCNYYFDNTLSMSRLKNN